MCRFQCLNSLGQLYRENAKTSNDRMEEGINATEGQNATGERRDINIEQDTTPD